MDKSDVVTLLVAIISGLFALASQQQSSKAVKANNKATVDATNIQSRADLETEAYMRARAMDVATIQRQDQEIEELNEKYDTLESKYETLEGKYEKAMRENRELRARVEALERHEREK